MHYRRMHPQAQNPVAYFRGVPYQTLDLTDLLNPPADMTDAIPVIVAGEWYWRQETAKHALPSNRSATA